MKHFGKMIVGACTVLTLTCTPAQLLAQSLSPSTQWEWNTFHSVGMEQRYHRDKISGTSSRTGVCHRFDCT